MTRHRNPAQKRQIITWAKALFERDNFYILDTETTGLNKDDEVIQIGIIDRQGTAVVDTLVRPGKSISLGAADVHGITETDLVDAPTIQDLYVRLSSQLAGQALIAYNIDFDWRILEQTMKRAGLPMIRPLAKHCAMKQYAQFYGQWNQRRSSYRWQKLTDACAQQNIPIVDAHSAVGDCQMTLSLLKKMAEG